MIKKMQRIIKSRVVKVRKTTMTTITLSNNFSINQIFKHSWRCSIKEHKWAKFQVQCLKEEINLVEEAIFWFVEKSWCPYGQQQYLNRAFTHLNYLLLIHHSWWILILLSLMMKIWMKGIGQSMTMNWYPKRTGSSILEHWKSEQKVSNALQHVKICLLWYILNS